MFNTLTPTSVCCKAVCATLPNNESPHATHHTPLPPTHDEDDCADGDQRNTLILLPLQLLVYYHLCFCVVEVMFLPKI